MTNITDSWPDIKKNCVIYEDEHILVLNKPVGISVIDNSQEIDLITLAKTNNEKLSPVHRIDKETSGAIVFAKEPSAHAELTKQFNKRTVNKFYLAITSSGGIPKKGRIDLPLSVGRKNRVRVAANREDILRDTTTNQWYVYPDKVLRNAKIYPSVTTFARAYENNNQTLIVVKPLTGRRHQIRVHLAWIGHPIVGDPLFDKSKIFSRTYLHAWKLEFTASWKNNKQICVEAVPDNDFWRPLVTELKSKEIQTIFRSAQETLDLLALN